MASPEQLHELIRQVRPLYRTLYRAVDRALAGSNITVGERAVLERLHDQGPQTVPAIARFLDLGRQPVQRVVDKLLSEQLVQRAENPSNRKSYLIQLSVGGSDLIHRVLGKEFQEIKRVSELLEQEDLEACLLVIQKVIAEFDKSTDDHG
jgi:DNA-binding MarR family transcriptional regulator